MTAPVPGAAAPAAEPRSSFIGDLRTVLGSSGFRKLYATRLISQTGDGVFNAGLGAYVFFNSASFPDPAAAATSFAVLYLPYSLIGPFAGVFIDRWSRRQIVLWSALLRAGFAALTAIFIGFGALDAPSRIRMPRPPQKSTTFMLDLAFSNWLGSHHVQRRDREDQPAAPLPDV